MGWAQLSNGFFLQAAEQAGFEVMISGDKNMIYQQNLTHRSIALIILTNIDWPTLKQTTPSVSMALDRVPEKLFQIIDTSLP